MGLSKVLISILFIYACDASIRQCNDCKLFRSCPGAVALAIENINEATQIKLTSALCGVENVNGKNLPKVCCSDFSLISDRTGILDDSSSTQELESHPKIALLPKDCGQIDGSRIVGGTTPNLWEFPWMTLISYKTRSGSGKNNFQFKCGGTIISSRYILTAAHCVVDKKLAGVRIGEFDINKETDCQGEYPNIYCEDYIQDIAIEESIPHEGFIISPVTNDIALLRLKNPIDFTPKNAKPICLPVQKNLLNLSLGNKIGTVAGWGITESGRESPILQKVDVPIFNATACRALYNKNSPKIDNTLKKLCAGDLKKDSCSGDSGGPLMIEETHKGNYKVIQYGIVSYGPKQCGSHFPGVYTDITYYMNWILNNIKP